jgi:hypothetical protein
MKAIGRNEAPLRTMSTATSPKTSDANTMSAPMTAKPGLARSNAIVSDMWPQHRGRFHQPITCHHLSSSVLT